MGQIVSVRLELYCEHHECRHRAATIFEAPTIMQAAREARRCGWRIKPGLGRIGMRMCICPEHKHLRFKSTYLTNAV